MLPRRKERAMWADNETEVDLLGFDFLVDTLFVALTEPKLLPLTVGLLGDWGSGKSTRLLHFLLSWVGMTVAEAAGT